MRKLLLGGVLALMAVSANSKESSNDDLCSMVARQAQETMKGRQNGESIVVHLDSNKNAYKKIKNKAAYELNKQMIIDAYKVPEFNTIDYKEKAIREFTNRYYISCIDGVY